VRLRKKSVFGYSDLTSSNHCCNFSSGSVRKRIVGASSDAVKPEGLFSYWSLQPDHRKGPPGEVAFHAALVWGSGPSPQLNIKKVIGNRPLHRTQVSRSFGGLFLLGKMVAWF
jgi:hypothetical protein